jgi:hypothetical protein
MEHKHEWNRWLTCDECGEPHLRECVVCGEQDEEQD